VDDVLKVSEAIERYGLGVMRNNVDRGRWQKPCRGVVVLHNGEVSQKQLLAVALASAARGAVLGGLSALTCEKFEGFSAPQPQIVLPSGARPPSMEGLEVHWSTQLDERDVHPLRTPRRTRPARSLVDAASWTKNPRHARAIVIAGVQQGLTETRQLREALSRRGPCRHRALIVESILDVPAGSSHFPSATSARSVGTPNLPSPIDNRGYADRTGTITSTPRGRACGCPRRSTESPTLPCIGGVPTSTERMRSSSPETGCWSSPRTRSVTSNEPSPINWSGWRARSGGPAAGPIFRR
jgi:hypothetical protein